ncbi:DUF2690 domain-containing protein [Amycolatopsis sp. BJA-103]|uniref:DUF2690 domain-containing protein n=1 Tax=Amycolatopsis sp. BJA-103 TaxID=1911175 RepID=UPI000C79560F|nr:DUF2690 domain-containing protein [Amycolatopsis sp. BJA-103]AUI57319.1 hypothetical protein BKN51_03215 [Amycolatopsis sp. BJA-103]
MRGKRIAVVALTMAGVSMMFATPASAAPERASCYGAACYGKNPITAGCNQDAVTIYVAGVSSLSVELRYSGACGAAWARIHGLVNDHGFAQNSQGHFAGAEIISGTAAFSNMVNDESGVTAYACVQKDQSTTRYCTPAY